MADLCTTTWRDSQNNKRHPKHACFQKRYHYGRCKCMCGQEK